MGLSRSLPGFGRWLQESGNISRSGDSGWVQESQAGVSSPIATITIVSTDDAFSGLTSSPASCSVVITSAADIFAGAAGIPASCSILITASGDSFSGSASSIALVTEPLKNNTGTVLANETGATALVYNVTTHALVVAKTGRTTDANGVMSIGDAALSASTNYRVIVILSSGAEGMGTYST